MRVMNLGKTLDEKIVGMLHDVLEDCPEYDFDYLRTEGFTEPIVFALKCLTKLDKDETYEAFIKRTEQSPLAVAVKINDLIDNMDIRRFSRPIESEDIKRLNKYLNAYRYLIEKY